MSILVLFVVVFQLLLALGLLFCLLLKLLSSLLLGGGFLNLLVLLFESSFKHMAVAATLMRLVPSVLFHAENLRLRKTRVGVVELDRLLVLLRRVLPRSRVHWLRLLFVRQDCAMAAPRVAANWLSAPATSSRSNQISFLSLPFPAIYLKILVSF